MILIAFGTRPEWIKIKPLIDVLNGNLEYKLLCTSQHQSLIDNNSKKYPIEYISIENHSNRLDDIVKSILAQSNKIFDNITSIIVHGDTTSALGLALGAFHRQIKIVHLEAGLRSWDKDSPYPEEFNRIAIDAMADIHLCPTNQCKENLRHVAGYSSKAYVVGNTVLDNLINIKPSLENIVLITMHRRENIPIIDKWFRSINNIAQKNKHLRFIFPMHPNPEIQKYRNILTEVEVTNPISYDECIDYLSKCCLVITDSGGLQEESSFFKKKCLVCRTTTERTEGEYIFSWLCYDPSQLENLFNRTSRELVHQQCPYGDGSASLRIKHILETNNVR